MLNVMLTGVGGQGTVLAAKVKFVCILLVSEYDVDAGTAANC